MANLAKPLNQGFAAPSIVANYGPYNTVAAAHAALAEDGLNVVGMTVGILTGNTIEEYWYQGGTAQSNLVPKKPTLATVATSGSYNDLTDKPTIPAPVDISGKADKSEMSITPGTGDNADKTTIQLKSGTSATVLTQHQDISGKADKITTYTKTEANTAIALATSAINAALAEKADTADVEESLATKQDTINDLATIRSGAALGATAQQPKTTLAGYGITDAYTKAEGQALETQVSAAINSVQDTVELLNGSDVVVVADHTTVTSPDGQKIYREQGSNSYTDWMYQDSSWKGIATYTMPGIDNAPTKNSSKLVDSGGVFKAIQDDAVFDVSAHNLDLNQNPTPYESLALALAAVPTDYKKGGMSIKFIKTDTTTNYGIVYSTSSGAVVDATNIDHPFTIADGNSYSADNILSVIGDSLDKERVETAINSLVDDGDIAIIQCEIEEAPDQYHLPTYGVWRITKNVIVKRKYVQYRLTTTAWSDVVANWQGVDDEPTAGSNNLVKSGGVYNSNNLFTHPIANKVIKELYIPGFDYTSVYRLQLCIAALHEGRYYNRIWLFYPLNGTSKSIVIYHKIFNTESEALEDISNMQGLQHSLGNDYYAIISADAFMAGTILWDVAISVNKDFADLNNSPILKGYIDSLDRFKGERALYIKNDGTLAVPSGVSRIFTTYVIAGKKYKIVSEAEANNRSVSFTSDFDGYTVIPHDVGGTSNVKSLYHIGTNVYTAPAGAKYMHITTQFRGDTNSLPYVSIREYESDLADIQADIQADLADIQADLAGDSEKYYYTNDTIPDSFYVSFDAELGTTFVQALSNLEGWYCLKLKVHKGEQIQVCASTKISTRQRPYVLTNLQNKVIRTSPVGGDFTTADTFTVESDGYLYVNNNSARLPMSNFFVKVAIHGLTLDKLREISIQSQEIVSDLASRVIPDDNNPLAVVKQTPGLTSILHRIGVVGASFTNGGHDKTDGTFGQEAGREFSWPQRLARLCGITCFNFGQSGYWCKYWLDNNGGYYDAVAEPENKCDAYIISFASNDKPSRSGYDLGTINDVHVGNESENGASYYGYLSQVIARCHEVQQRAYLFVLTYPGGYDITESGGYTQAMRDVVDVYRAAGYKIYLIDYAAYGMSAAEATAKNLKRGTHYVAAGYQYMTYEICTYIDWIIRHNIEDFEDAAFVRTTAAYVPTGGTPVGYDKNDFFVGPEHNKYLNIDYRRPRFYYTKAEVDALIAELRAELVTNQ